MKKIQSSYHAFAAILGDARVVTWGHPDFGADSSEVPVRVPFKEDPKEIYPSSTLARFEGTLENPVVTVVRAL